MRPAWLDNQMVRIQDVIRNYLKYISSVAASGPGYVEHKGINNWAGARRISYSHYYLVAIIVIIVIITIIIISSLLSS